MMDVASAIEEVGTIRKPMDAPAAAEETTETTSGAVTVHHNDDHGSMEEDGTQQQHQDPPEDNNNEGVISVAFFSSLLWGTKKSTETKIVSDDDDEPLLSKDAEFRSRRMIEGGKDESLSPSDVEGDFNDDNAPQGDAAVVSPVSPNRESAIQDVSEQIFDDSKTTTTASHSQPPETTMTTTTMKTTTTTEVKRGQEPEGEELLAVAGVSGSGILDAIVETNNLHDTDEIENSPKDSISTPDDTTIKIRIAQEKISKICQSDSLTVESLRDEIALLPPECECEIECDASVFLHHVCGNANVTLEMIQYLLSIFPEAASSSSSAKPFEEDHHYPPPLHMACYNDCASREVIELLIKANPSALLKMSLMEEGEGDGGGDAIAIQKNNTDDPVVEGLPLHYYLMRERNMDLGTVQMLVEAYPRALGAGDDMSKLTPIHALVSNPNIAAGVHVDDDDHDNTPLLLNVVRYLVHAKPSSIRMIDERDRIPLHSACTNRNANYATVKFLIDYWPESTHQRDENGNHPIHSLCGNVELDHGVSMEILALLIQVDWESVKYENDVGFFPIHLAAKNGKPPDFCEVLVNAYPESVKMTSDDGSLPLHMACGGGCLDTTMYLAELNPRGLDVKAAGGMLPIHVASNGKANFEIIEYLLQRDPDCASKSTDGAELPFHMACKSESNIDTVRLLFDTYPEALILEDDETDDATSTTTKTTTSTEASSSAGGRPNTTSFLRDQTSHARTALDIVAMHTLDESGCLPLHRALRRRAALGAVKLLLKGNPSALRVATYDNVFPLHVACERCGLDVVRFLAERLDVRCFEDVDSSGNSALHYACRGGNCDVVRWLLEGNVARKSRRVASFAERNGEGKFPIQLLAEYCKKEGEDCQSPKFGLTVSCLRMAYPERVFAGGVL